jgi:transcriptional regulator with XRE-family HTH domain
MFPRNPIRSSTESFDKIFSVNFPRRFGLNLSPRATVARGDAMTQPSSPTVWRRWMAFELRRLRQDAGLSQADVAKHLGCKVPKISLIESGQRNVQEDDLHRLLSFYEVPDGERSGYLEAARAGRKKGWWERYSQHTMPPWLEPQVGFEQGAERARTYHPTIITGLLQIREYAAAVLRRGVPDTSQEKVERQVELRLKRQEALWRDADPLHLWAVMDEAVLHRVVDSRETMRAQLAHILDVVDKHRHVTVQIVPFERGAYDQTYVPFVILNFPRSTEPGAAYDPGVVYIEHRSHSVHLDALSDIDQHSQAFERLCALALPPDESIDLIRNVAEVYTA